MTLDRQAAILASWTDDSEATWRERLGRAAILCFSASAVITGALTGPRLSTTPLTPTSPQAGAETLIARDLLPADAFDSPRKFACSFRAADHARCDCAPCTLERNHPQPFPRALWMLFGWACQDYGALLQAEALAQVVARETYKKDATIEWYVERKEGGEKKRAASHLWMLTPNGKGKLFDLGVTLRPGSATDPVSRAEAALAALGFPIRLVTTPKYPEDIETPVLQLLCEAPCVTA